MSEQAPHICFDRILPSDMRRLAGPSASMRERAAIFRAKKWPVGSTLRVKFMSGSNAQKDIVRQFAPEWADYANLKFEFGNDSDSEIRIRFDANLGAWSYIGIDCLEIPLDQPTMNLGWQDEGVVLHEFGHAIGLIHEHQNPTGGINWNRPNVIRDLSGPPNNWTLDTIEHNIFEKYDQNQLNSTTLDPESIMMYSIPASWTLDGFHTDANDVLSEVDKTFIGDAVNYPKDNAGGGEVEVPVSEISSVQGSIGAPGEQDLYVFEAASARKYAVETTGSTDLVMALYGPNSKTTLIAQDDDSGADRNPRIERNLAAGKYYVQIKHYSPTKKGSYSIQVTTMA